jgi:hypothetical protein
VTYRYALEFKCLDKSVVDKVLTGETVKSETSVASTTRKLNCMVSDMSPVHIHFRYCIYRLNALLGLRSVDAETREIIGFKDFKLNVCECTASDQWISIAGVLVKTEARVVTR